MGVRAVEFRLAHRRVCAGVGAGQAGQVKDLAVGEGSTGHEGGFAHHRAVLHLGRRLPVGGGVDRAFGVVGVRGRPGGFFQVSVVRSGARAGGLVRLRRLGGVGERIWFRVAALGDGQGARGVPGEGGGADRQLVTVPVHGGDHVGLGVVAEDQVVGGQPVGEAAQFRAGGGTLGVDHEDVVEAVVPRGEQQIGLGEDVPVERA